jgi:hypothetical protein
VCAAVCRPVSAQSSTRRCLGVNPRGLNGVHVLHVLSCLLFDPSRPQNAPRACRCPAPSRACVRKQRTGARLAHQRSGRRSVYYCAQVVRSALHSPHAPATRLACRAPRRMQLLRAEASIPPPIRAGLRLWQSRGGRVGGLAGGRAAWQHGTARARGCSRALAAAAQHRSCGARASAPRVRARRQRERDARPNGDRHATCWHLRASPCSRLTRGLRPRVATTRRCRPDQSGSRGGCTPCIAQ